MIPRAYGLGHVPHFLLNGNSEMFKKGISCPNCYEITTIKQKKSFEERNKQISLAKKKGIKHLGN